MKRLTIIAILLLLTAGTRAQLQSYGIVPDDLKMSTMELYESDVQRAKKYTGGRIVRNKQSLLEAAYRVNKMMASGRIVYGDPISELAARIADTLLVDYPELRSELRFYTVKSPEVNAFATGQGMIFINVGLMAQVENEAQLAFIISHEIIHYYRSHTMEELVGKDGKKRTTDSDREDMEQFMKRHSRSREMENEADSLGIALFYLKSPYDRNVTEGVFDVLQYSALPFDDVAFDTTWFNTPYYTLSGCWLDTTASITSRDDYDDSRSTHPNILSRRRSTAQAFDGYYGGEEFVVTDREDFMAIRDIAREECIRQELIAGEYSRAFYNAWLIMRNQKPGDGNYEYVAEMMAQALYGVAMFKIHNGTNSVAGDYKKVEGESQQVYYAFRRMTQEQAALAALHRIWQLHTQYPQNEAFAVMCTDLMDAMHNTLRTPFSTFEAQPPSAQADTTATQEDEAGLSKYERIKRKRQSQNKQGVYAYALTDLQMGDSAFSATLRHHMAGAPAAKQEDSTASDGGVFIYSSSYLVVNNKSDKLNVEKSQRGEQDLADIIIRTGKRYERATVDFSDRGLHQMETDEQYNDFVVLNEWVNEFWQNKGQFNLRRITQPAMNDLIERYGASTVSVNAVLNNENVGNRSEFIAAAILLVPAIPIGIYQALIPDDVTSMETMVIDAAKGKILSRQSYKSYLPDDRALLGSMLNDSYSRAFKGKASTGVCGRHFAIMGGAQLAFTGHNDRTGYRDDFVSFTPWAAAELGVKDNGSLAVGWSHLSAPESIEYYKDKTTWSLTWRFYKRGYAPMGPNFGCGLQMVHYNTPGDGSSDKNYYGLHLSAGHNFIFFERFVLNIEARYGCNFGMINAYFSGQYLKDRFFTDVLLHNLIQLRIGLGFMPF